jgi:hypothetical protein
MGVIGIKVGMRVGISVGLAATVGGSVATVFVAGGTVGVGKAVSVWATAVPTLAADGVAGACRLQAVRPIRAIVVIKAGTFIHFIVSPLKKGAIPDHRRWQDASGGQPGTSNMHLPQPVRKSIDRLHTTVRSMGYPILAIHVLTSGRTDKFPQLPADPAFTIII